MEVTKAGNEGVRKSPPTATEASAGDRESALDTATHTADTPTAHAAAASISIGAKGDNGCYFDESNRGGTGGGGGDDRYSPSSSGPPTTFPPLSGLCGSVAGVASDGHSGTAGLRKADRPATATAGARQATRDGEAGGFGESFQSLPAPNLTSNARLTRMMPAPPLSTSTVVTVAGKGAPATSDARTRSFKDRQRAAHGSPRFATLLAPDTAGASSQPNSAAAGTAAAAAASSIRTSPSAQPRSSSPSSQAVIQKLSFKDRLRAGATGALHPSAAGPNSVGSGSFSSGHRRRPDAVPPLLAEAQQQQRQLASVRPLSSSPSTSPVKSSGHAGAETPVEDAGNGQRSPRASMVAAAASMVWAGVRLTPTPPRERSLSPGASPSASGGVAIAANDVPTNHLPHPPSRPRSPAQLMLDEQQRQSSHGAAATGLETSSPEQPLPRELASQRTLAVGGGESPMTMPSTKEADGQSPEMRDATVIFDSSGASEADGLRKPSTHAADSTKGVAATATQPPTACDAAGATAAHKEARHRSGSSGARPQQSGCRGENEVDVGEGAVKMRVDLLGCTQHDPVARAYENGEPEPVPQSMATATSLELNLARLEIAASAAESGPVSKGIGRKHSDPAPLVPASLPQPLPLAAHRDDLDGSRWGSDAATPGGTAISVSYLSEMSHAPFLGHTQTFESPTKATQHQQQQQQQRCSSLDAPAQMPEGLMTVAMEPPLPAGHIRTTSGGNALAKLPIGGTHSPSIERTDAASTTRRQQGKMVDRRTGATVTYPAPLSVYSTPHSGCSTSRTVATATAASAAHAGSADSYGCDIPRVPASEHPRSSAEATGEPSDSATARGSSVNSPVPSTAAVGAPCPHSTSSGALASGATGGGGGPAAWSGVSPSTMTSRSLAEHAAHEFVHRLQMQLARGASVGTAPSDEDPSPPVSASRGGRSGSTASGAPTTATTPPAGAGSTPYRRPSTIAHDMAHPSAPESVDSQPRDLVGTGGSHSDLLSTTFNSVAALRDMKRTSSFSSLQFSMKPPRRHRAAAAAATGGAGGTAGVSGNRKQHVVVAPGIPTCATTTEATAVLDARTAPLGEAPLGSVVDRGASESSLGEAGEASDSTITARTVSQIAKANPAEDMQAFGKNGGSNDDDNQSVEADDTEVDDGLASAMETKGGSDMGDAAHAAAEVATIEEKEAFLTLLEEEEELGLQPRRVGMWETAEHIFIPTYERLEQNTDLQVAVFRCLRESVGLPVPEDCLVSGAEKRKGALHIDEAALAATAASAVGPLSPQLYCSPVASATVSPANLEASGGSGAGQRGSPPMGVGSLPPSAGPMSAPATSTTRKCPCAAAAGAVEPTREASQETGASGSLNKRGDREGCVGEGEPAHEVHGGAVFAFGAVAKDYNLGPAEDDPNADCKVAARLLFDADHGVMLLAPQDEVGRFMKARTTSSPPGGAAAGNGVGDGENGDEKEDDDGACECDEAFIGKDSRGMDYSKYHAHTLYDHCTCCHRRPACFLCLHCFKAVCPTHVQRHHRRNPATCTLFLNILDVMTSFDRIFWCERCRRFTWRYTEIYDPLVDQIAYTRGTYLPRAVRDIHCFGAEAVLREAPPPRARIDAASLAASPLSTAVATAGGGGTPGLPGPHVSGAGLGATGAGVGGADPPHPPARMAQPPSNLSSPPHHHRHSAPGAQSRDMDSCLTGASPFPVLEMGCTSPAFSASNAASTPAFMHFTGGAVTTTATKPFAASDARPARPLSGSAASGGAVATANPQRAGPEPYPALIGTVANAGGSQCYSMPLNYHMSLSAAAAAVSGSLDTAPGPGAGMGTGAGSDIAPSPMAELLHRDPAALSEGNVVPVGSAVTRLAAVGASVQGWRATQEDAETAFLVYLPALRAPQGSDSSRGDAKNTTGGDEQKGPSSPNSCSLSGARVGEVEKPVEKARHGKENQEDNVDAGRIPMAVYCVFDGHGGDAVAKLAARHFEDHMRRAIARARPDDIRARALLFYVDAETAVSPRQRAISTVSNRPSPAASMTTPMASLSASPKSRPTSGTVPRHGASGAMGADSSSRLAPSPTHLHAPNAVSGSASSSSGGGYRFAGPLLVPGAVLSGPVTSTAAAISSNSASPHRAEESLGLLPSPRRIAGASDAGDGADLIPVLTTAAPGGVVMSEGFAAEQHPLRMMSTPSAILAPVTAASLAQHVSAEEAQRAALEGLSATGSSGSPHHRPLAGGGADAGRSAGTGGAGAGTGRDASATVAAAAVAAKATTGSAAAKHAATLREQQQAERTSSLVRRWEQEGMAAITGANCSPLLTGSGSSSAHGGGSSTRNSSPLLAATAGSLAGDSSPLLGASALNCTNIGLDGALPATDPALAAARVAAPRPSSGGHHLNHNMVLSPSAVVTVPEVKMLQNYFASIMEDALLSLDEYLQRTEEGMRGDYNCVGCTACVVGITPSFILCANVGDSGACFYNQEVIEPIAIKHRLTDPEEQARVITAGYSIDNNRIEGMLAVPRALGDFDFKQCGGKGPREQAVIAVPDVTIRPVPTTTTEAVVRTAAASGGTGVDGDTSEDRWGIIVACDGVWDTATLHQVHHALVNTPNDLDVAASVTEATLRAKDLVRHHRRGPVHFLGDMPRRDPRGSDSSTAPTSPLTRSEPRGMVAGTKASECDPRSMPERASPALLQPPHTDGDGVHDDEDDVSYVEDLGGDAQASDGIDSRLLTAAAGVFAQCVAPADNEQGIGLDNCSLLLIERRA